MNTSEHFAHGDVVNITVTPTAYPYELSYDWEGVLTTNLTLQGRVLYADSLGIAIATDGARCMPTFGFDWGEVNITPTTRGTFFPWASVEVIVFVTDSASYFRACVEQEAKELVYADAHDDTVPETFAQWRTWTATQDKDTLAAALDAAARNVLKERAA